MKKMIVTLDQAIRIEDRLPFTKFMSETRYEKRYTILKNRIESAVNTTTGAQKELKQVLSVFENTVYVLADADFKKFMEFDY